MKKSTSRIRFTHERRNVNEVGKMGLILTSIKGIRLMNIGCWLADQISRPDWFQRLFLQRTMWGAFSIYSHVKRSNSKPKIAFPSKSKAENAAVDMAKKYGKPFTVYKCLFCDGWHVSQDAYGLPVKEKSTEALALEMYAKKPIVQTTELDVEKVLSTGIPDLAPVYGGFRGRTLSSTKQLHAWNTMMEAGINQVIDLRADYTSGFYSELCKKSGISYFHYSVSYEEVEQMARLFPEFCRLIDNGRFYIACAMGLHRTDIALCTYWVFYAADKGIAPPEIRGYRRADGHDTGKIMRILNALYKYWTAQNGKEPMPITVFRERKEIINELSYRTD
ncbi:MAG: hypothetical protein J6O49_13265 [Bacteroidaceae bacterium]|nr:hypothetical protein [Bacteroidaceae bacterium]